ncbi:unnamed protein product [Fusarium equiseti]|uniref:Uncharacterized protein n=1 Tax=Fusarium equiseti TaxID=61235 RepID=A0A8J2IJE9_FUSEQ|nr:unnamed protein product [Fusarium equiseti]
MDSPTLSTPPRFTSPPASLTPASPKQACSISVEPSIPLHDLGKNYGTCNCSGCTGCTDEGFCMGDGELVRW